MKYMDYYFQNYHSYLIQSYDYLCTYLIDLFSFYVCLIHDNSYNHRIHIIILPESDKDLKVRKEKCPSIHIFTDNKYYDRTYARMMIYSRLKKKLPVIYFNF